MQIPADRSAPAIAYAREERPRAPVREIVIKRFDDGGVTIRAPMRLTGPNWRARFWFAVVVLGVLIGFSSPGGPQNSPARALSMPFAPFVVMAGVLLVVSFYNVYLKAQPPARTEEVLGISPLTVYVDTAKQPPIEVAREELVAATVLKFESGAQWASGVQLLFENGGSVLFCEGRREKEIWDMCEVVQRALAETAPPRLL